MFYNVESARDTGDGTSNLLAQSAMGRGSYGPLAEPLQNRGRPHPYGQRFPAWPDGPGLLEQGWQSKPEALTIAALRYGVYRPLSVEPTAKIALGQREEEAGYQRAALRQLNSGWHTPVAP